MRTLDDLRVHIWTLFTSDVRGAAWLAYCESILSGAERERARRRVSMEDRQMFVLSHGFLRSVLSRYAAMAPQDWVFSVSAHGKPGIANPAHGGSLQFNLSHTRGAVAVAVARGASLGVDIEQVRQDPEAVSLAQRFFSAREAADVCRGTLSERSSTFYRYWTLKEAYLKARGEGLSVPLDQFGFVFQAPDRIGFAAETALDANPSDWRFCHTALAQDHVLSVCVGRQPTQVEAEVLRCIDPAGGGMHRVTLALQPAPAPGAGFRQDFQSPPDRPSFGRECLP